MAEKDYPKFKVVNFMEIKKARQKEHRRAVKQIRKFRKAMAEGKLKKVA